MQPFYITIKKPLFDNFCYIRNETLRDAYVAMLHGRKVIVKIPQGEGEINPKKWKETGKRMSKVFNIPNRPMILYGNYVPIEGMENGPMPDEKDVQPPLI